MTPESTHRLTQTKRGLFVTATDTSAGKTTLLCKLIRQLEKTGLALHIRKPVESGCVLKNGRLTPLDATALADASCHHLSVEQVCPYRLRHTSSPARAAQLEHVELTIQQLAEACTVGTDDQSFSLIEGAGGFYSPIARDGLNADLACLLGLPLLIVIESRLGCINHALLTIEAAQRRQIPIASIVVNQTTQMGDTDNYEELKSLTEIPVFKMNYETSSNQKTDANIETLVEYLLNPSTNTTKLS